MGRELLQKSRPRLRTGVLLQHTSQRVPMNPGQTHNQPSVHFAELLALPCHNILYFVAIFRGQPHAWVAGVAYGGDSFEEFGFIEGGWQKEQG